MIHIPFHFDKLGYAGLYFSLALGILGVPIPDEALMTYIGYLIFEGEFKLEYALVISFLGSITGMTLSYLIGRGLLGRLAGRLEKKINIAHKYARFQELFDKYEHAIIIIGYFIPGIRHLSAYSSGFLKTSYFKFITSASIGASLWVTTFIFLGYYLGHDWRHFMHYTLLYKKYVVLFSLFAAGAAVFLYARKIK